MKRSYAIAGLCACLTLGLVIANQPDAGAEEARVVAPIQQEHAVTDQAPPVAPVLTSELTYSSADTSDILAKKCSFNSDCSHGNCKSGKCGACSFNSDCKGWGVCKSGHCGGCNFSSECKGFGSCSSGKCTKSPY
jgi:hypothetical protein